MVGISRVTPTSELLDDFALRRGHVYGTVLIDMDTHRPVDLLPDRDADTLAAWLREHPGVAVVCRDRAGAYAEGAATGAPDAKQVADRWHLWHNLAEHTEKTVARHRGCWAQPAEDPAGDRPPAESDARPDTRPDLGRLAEQAALDRREASALAIRTPERYAAVQALRAQGKGIKTIMRELGLAKETVRRFARAGCVEDLLATARDGRSSVLDEFKPYLHHGFNLGHTNGSALFTEIRAQGYRGSLGTVLGYLRPFRTLGAAPQAVPPPPTVRAVTSAILRHPDRRDADAQLMVKQVRAACPHVQLDAARGVEIGHTRSYGFGKSRHSSVVIQPPVTAEATATIDDMAEPTSHLAATAAALVDELGQSFGVSELAQLSRDGALRTQYWASGGWKGEIIAWAEKGGIVVTDARLT